MGLIILIYPDDGYPVVVKLNDAHGPSLPDLIGLVFIVTAYSLFVYSIFKSHKGPIYKKIFMLSNVLLIGVCLGLYFENEWVLWSAVGIAVSIQMFVIFKLLSAKSRN
ncbi:MAG: hypothetical protein C0490_17220 [Marivirga sp.]|nr:hypothetical protein [Marivirga sp.]